MRYVALIFFPLLAFAWLSTAYTKVSNAATSGPVILTDEQEEYPLGLNLEILEDPSRELTIEDVSSPEFNSRFTASAAKAPNYGYTDSAYWVRMHLINEARQSNRWLLEVVFGNMQFVDLYIPSPSGQGFIVKQSGSLRPVSMRDVRYPNMIFELTLPSQSQQTYYLRFQSSASMTLPLILWSPGAFMVKSQQALLRYGLYFGVMFGLLGYNLFLLLSLREKSHLYLTIFLAVMIIFEGIYSGYLETFLIPTLYQLKHYLQALFFSLIFVLALLFSDAFLDLKGRHAKLYQLNIAILGVWAVLIVLIPFTSYLTIARPMSYWGMLSLVVVLVAGMISWRGGLRSARFYMIAWLGMVVTVILVLLVRLGLSSSTPISENAYQLGVTWMAICWSIALADRINLLKGETEDTKHRLSQILEGLPLGVLVYGVDQKPSFANKRAIEILSNPGQEIEPDPLAGRTLSEAMDYYSIQLANSDQPYPLEDLPIYHALQGKTSFADDSEVDLVDSRVPLEIWARQVMDDSGEVEAAVVTIQDISDRKQAETALLASEQKFRVIVENAFDGIVFMAHDRQVLYVSPSYSRFSGIKMEESVGQTGVGYVHPDDRELTAQVFAELLQQPGSKATIEYRSKHQDGTWMWVETNGLNLLDDPYVQAVVLNIRDITERKQAEAALVENRQNLELLVQKRTAELSAINEWLSGLKQVRQAIGGVVDLPAANKRLLSLVLQVLKADLAFLLCWDDQGKAIEAASVQDKDDPGRDFKQIVSFVMNDITLRQEIAKGKLIHLSADQATAMKMSIEECFQDTGVQTLLLIPMDADQPVSGVLGMALIRPMQELRPAQAELVKTMALDLLNLAESAQYLDQEQALAVAEERNRLARELHDSVTQILFSASMLAESTPRLWLKDQEIARMNMEKLSILLRGALAEMRILLFELRSGEPKRQSLENQLSTLADAVRARSAVAISLKVDGASKLPDNVIEAYSRIAREALNNMVVHSGATQVTISLLAEEQGTEFHIRDNGIGFNLDQIPEGHYGISIMAERASKIGGELKIKSSPGQGTEIIVTNYGNEG